LFLVLLSVAKYNEDYAKGGQEPESAEVQEQESMDDRGTETSIGNLFSEKQIKTIWIYCNPDDDGQPILLNDDLQPVLSGGNKQIVTMGSGGNFGTLINAKTGENDPMRTLIFFVTGEGTFDEDIKNDITREIDTHWKSYTDRIAWIRGLDLDFDQSPQNNP
jgi:hypothetical protein